MKRVDQFDNFNTGTEKGLSRTHTVMLLMQADATMLDHLLFRTLTNEPQWASTQKSVPNSEAGLNSAVGSAGLNSVVGSAGFNSARALPMGSRNSG